LLTGFQSSFTRHRPTAGSQEDGEGQKFKGESSSQQRIRYFKAVGKLCVTQDHPNIVKMYEMFEDSTHYYIVTEYLEGKDALELLQTSKVITEETAWSIFYQLLLAVNHIHLNKFMHRLFPSYAETSNWRILSTTRN
jgi:serine/threonine protein kinase